ncbi:MAG: hypothetical protein HY060_24270 [Proteobacteria bacterium]|nr:hypothetical protein [Pseudomonadota bacterium]
MGGFLRVAALLGIGLVAACTPKVFPDQISAVKPGQTTYEQVVDTFGLPTSELMLAGGSKVLLYYHDQFDRSAGQMIPFANLFDTSYDRTIYDYFIFNREGVLQSFSIPQFARGAGVENPGT